MVEEEEEEEEFQEILTKLVSFGQLTHTAQPKTEFGFTSCNKRSEKICAELKQRPPKLRQATGCKTVRMVKQKNFSYKKYQKKVHTHIEKMIACTSNRSKTCAQIWLPNTPNIKLTNKF